MSKMIEALKAMTPEEKKEHYAKIQETKAKNRQKKIQHHEAIQAKAEELAPALLAQKYIDETSERPSPEIIAKLRILVEGGLTLETMRIKHFSKVPEDKWLSLKKYLFQDHINQAEDLGLTLMDTLRRGIRRTIRRVRSNKRIVRKLEKQAKKEKKVYNPPYGILKMIQEDENELHKLELEVAKALYSVGAVADTKKKSGDINIQFNVNRPDHPDRVIKLAKEIVGSGN